MWDSEHFRQENFFFAVLKYLDIADYISENQHFYPIQQFQYSRDKEREKYECKIYHDALLQTALPSISPRPVCYTAA